jgi:hypothetical protein
MILKALSVMVQPAHLPDRGGAEPDSRRVRMLKSGSDVLPKLSDGPQVRWPVRLVAHRRPGVAEAFRNPAPPRRHDPS